MAITYHAGRRIQGLERTGSTITDVDSPWVFANSSGSVSNGVVSFDYNQSTTDRGYHDLGANASGTWVFRFRLNITNKDVPSGSNYHCKFGLGDNYVVGSTAQGGIHFALNHSGVGSTYTRFHARSSYNQTFQGSTSGTSTPSTYDYSESTNYFVEVIRTGTTTGTINVYTNSNYTDNLVYTSVLSGINASLNVRYIIIATDPYGDQGSTRYNGTMDQMKFYDGITSVVATAGDIKPTNVQVGSRFEETDTRKMYHYESPSVTFEDDFSSSPNGWTLGSGQTIESGYLYADGNDVLSSKPLAIGEPTNFLFDFDYAPVDGAPRITFVVLNSEIGGYGAASSGHKRIIFGLHQNGLSMDIRYRISGSSEVEVISIDSTVPPYDGTISYYRMIKTSGNITVKRYASDANRTSDTSSTDISLNFTEAGYSGTADLAYLVVGGAGSTSGYSRNAKLYDFKFYSGVTSLDNVWSEEGT